MAISFNLPDPYEAQKAEIARRQKYAEALQQQAFQPIETSSYQGIQAPIPATAVLAKILQGGLGGYMAGQAAKEQKELREGDIVQGQKFAEALRGAKTPEERSSIALEALGGGMGQRAQAMAGPMLTMAEAEAEKRRQEAFRAAESQARRDAEDRRAREALDLRRDIALGQQAITAELGRGRLEMAQAENERRARESQEKARQPTVQAINTYNSASSAEQEAGSVASRMAGHIEDIKSGKLNLGVFANPINRARNWAGISSDEGVRLAALDRDIISAANVILMRAKGTQTEGDARRAVDQILAKATSSSPKIVEDALKDLIEKSRTTQNAYRTTLNQLGDRFNLGHEPLPMIAIPAAPGAAAPAPAAGGGAAPPSRINTPAGVVTIQRVQ